MTETEHTPTPWHEGFADGSGRAGSDQGAYITSGNAAVVRGGNDDYGIPIGVISAADAEFIVTACNAYDDLLAALRAFMDCFGGHSNIDAWLRTATAYSAARAAIAKAEAPGGSGTTKGRIAQ